MKKTEKCKEAIKEAHVNKFSHFKKLKQRRKIEKYKFELIQPHILGVGTNVQKGK